MMNPIAIPYEPGDLLVHTDDHPFCSDCSCPCHDIQDGRYYELICKPYLAGLLTGSEANRLYFGDNPLDYLEGMRADFKAASATLPSYEQAEVE
jgi:hypothetical protein